MKASLVQLGAGADRAENLASVERGVREAAGAGSDLVVLPEACTYRGPFARAYVEGPDGPARVRISELAAELGIAVVVGGIWTPSSDPDRPFNTAIVYDHTGREVAHYDKVHLFQLHAVDGPVEDETTFTTPGDTCVVVDVAGMRLGLGICYDLRFPGLYHSLARAGAQVLLAPSNFASETGRAHWAVLVRARAIENLCYVLAPAQIGADDTGFHAYGNSAAVDPWGAVLAEAGGDTSEVLTVDVEPAVVDQRRQQMRSLEHHVPETYARVRPAGGLS